MESSNKKFLAPAAVSAGEFSGNVYRLTEEFRQGEKKGTNHTRAPCYSPAVSKCKIKKKKCRFQIVAPPHPFSRKKKSGGAVLGAPNFSPRKSLDSLLFLGSGNCLNAI